MYFSYYFVGPYPGQPYQQQPFGPEQQPYGPHAPGQYPPPSQNQYGNQNRMYPPYGPDDA